MNREGLGSCGVHQTISILPIGEEVTEPGLPPIQCNGFITNSNLGDVAFGRAGASSVGLGEQILLEKRFLLDPTDD